MTGPLLMVLIAAVLHATWNLLAKQAAAAGPAFVLANNFFACIFYLPWVAWVIFNGGMTWTVPVAVCIAASAFLHLAYSLALQRGYQVADLSVVYPIARGSGPAIAAIGGFVLLAETPTPLRVAGLLAVVTGIGLIATQANLSRFREAGARAGVRWGLLTGALIAGYTVNDAYGVKLLLIAPILLDWFGNTARFAMLLPVVMSRPANAAEAMRGHWARAAIVGLISPLGYILVLSALQMGAPLSLVAPARELSMMVGAVFGIYFLREAAGPWRILGCLVLIGGVVMLGAS